MNVTFHTLVAIGLAQSYNKRSYFLQDYCVIFLLGIMLHGVMDFLPHTYPLDAKLDIILSLIIFAIIWYIQPLHRWLFFWSFLGHIFPDLIDLGPAILNGGFPINLPKPHIFPWHWSAYSGSIFDGGTFWSRYGFHGLVLFFILLLFVLGIKKRRA